MNRHLKLGIGLGLAWLLMASGCSDEADPTSTPSDFPNWPSYGGDLDNTRDNAEEATLSSDNVAELVERWSFEGMPVTGTPTLYGDVLYFGSWRGDVHAVDPRTGKQVWKQSVGDQVNNTLCVTKDHVFVMTAGTNAWALDRKTGRPVWGPIKLEETQGAQIWSSPVFVDGQLIVGLGSFQVFLGQSTTARGSVIALDALSGEVLWQTYMTKADATQGAGVSVWSSAAVDTERKMIYIGTGQTYHPPASPLADSLVALDFDTGEIKWSVQFTQDDIFTSATPNGDDYDVGAAPNLFTVDGEDLVGVGDKRGYYYVLTRDEGAPRWERELTKGSNNGGVMATAAYSDGVVYVASNQGDSGRVGGSSSGPQKQTTYALDAKDGSVKWMVDLEPSTFGAVSIANGVLYVPTIDGALHALDASNGNVLFSKTQGVAAAGGPTIGNGMVFVGHGWQWLPSGSMKGGLTAYALPE